MSARETIMSFRRGWHDGSGGRAKDRKFTEHETRPDLTADYLRGYESGTKARVDAMQQECERIGYAPSLLREDPTP